LGGDQADIDDAKKKDFQNWPINTENMSFKVKVIVKEVGLRQRMLIVSTPHCNTPCNTPEMNGRRKQWKEKMPEVISHFQEHEYNESR
jgi:hypothetical protein